MFIGHFAVGFAAKSGAPRGSLGTYVAASIFLDMLWPLFLLAGIEQVRVVPGITRMNPFDFISYPWSHSALMAAIWAALFAFIYYRMRRDLWTAKVMAGVVFSHWVLDWVTHRPDLQIVPGWDFRTGLGLWSTVPGTVSVEVAMFLAAAWWYEWSTEALDGIGRWAWFTLVLVLLALYALTVLGPPPQPGQEKLIALTGVLTWIFIPWAARADRHRVFR